MVQSKPEKVFPHLLYDTLAERNPQKTFARRTEELNRVLFKVVRDTALLDAVKEYGLPIDFARFEPYQNKDTAEYQHLRLEEEGLLVVIKREKELAPTKIWQEPSGRVYFLKMNPSGREDVSLAEFMNQDHIITANQVYNSLEKEIMDVINLTLL